MSMEVYYKKATNDEIEKLQSGEISANDFFSDDNICIDQAWGVLHYALTGEAYSESVLSSSIFGCEPVSDEEVGYGPLMYCSVEEVLNISAELNNITYEMLENNLDVDAMADAAVYAAELGEDKEYVYSMFDTVKNLFNDAAQNGENIVICVS